jgi:hypothetical protein
LVSVLGAFVTSFEFCFSHALPVEFDAVGVVYETVENGICEGRLSDHVMPCVDGQLAGRLAELASLYQVSAPALIEGNIVTKPASIDMAYLTGVVGAVQGTVNRLGVAPSP